MTDHEATARAALENLVEGAAIEIYGAAYRGDREDKLTGQRFPEPGWCWDRCGDVAQAFARKQAHAALLSPLVVAAFAAMVEERDKLLCDLREVNANNASQFARAEAAEAALKAIAPAIHAAARQTWEAERAALLLRIEKLERDSDKSYPDRGACI